MYYKLKENPKYLVNRGKPIEKIKIVFYFILFRSIGCVKSFVPLGSQNVLSGVDHLQNPNSLSSIVVLTGSHKCVASLCCRVDMTAGSDLVFDNLSHNHIGPRTEYHFF